jgi:hypothetical protein
MSQQQVRDGIARKKKVCQNRTDLIQDLFGPVAVPEAEIVNFYPSNSKQKKKILKTHFKTKGRKIFLHCFQLQMHERIQQS